MALHTPSVQSRMRQDTPGAFRLAAALQAARSYFAGLGTAGGVRKVAVRARQALAWVAAQHAVVARGWNGLRPYRDAPPETWFVEASIAQPLAHARMGQREVAQQQWLPLAQLACAGGMPVVYAPDWHADFPLTPATAPTIWWLIVGQEIAEGGAPWLWAER